MNEKLIERLKFYWFNSFDKLFKTLEIWRDDSKYEKAIDFLDTLSIDWIESVERLRENKHKNDLEIMERLLRNMRKTILYHNSH
jgi:hypothetical protein